jgi:HPt (histidine-containing phosphotransfer) domain-containing protein
MNSVYAKYNNFDSFDPTKLDQLIALGKDIEEDVLGQLILVHKESSEVALSEMHGFLKEKQSDELRRSAHKFKSSSANLGLMRLHKLCGDLEAYIVQNSSGALDYSVIKEYVESIQHEFNQTNQKLFSYQKAA